MQCVDRKSLKFGYSSEEAGKEENMHISCMLQVPSSELETNLLDSSFILGIEMEKNSDSSFRQT